MIFKRKGEKLTLEELANKYPEDYAQLMEQAKEAAAKDRTSETETEVEVSVEESAEVKKLKAENAKLKKERAERETKDRIKKYGDQLGVSKKAAECIEQGMSFEDALVSMVDAQGEYIKNVNNSFEDTSPEAAGADTQSEKTSDEPETFAEAMKIIKKRDDCSMTEAAEKAQKEYKELFDAQYETAK